MGNAAGRGAAADAEGGGGAAARAVGGVDPQTPAPCLRVLEKLQRLVVEEERALFAAGERELERLTLIAEAEAEGKDAAAAAAAGGERNTVTEGGRFDTEEAVAAYVEACADVARVCATAGAAAAERNMTGAPAATVTPVMISGSPAPGEGKHGGRLMGRVRSIRRSRSNSPKRDGSKSANGTGQTTRARKRAALQRPTSASSKSGSSVSRRRRVGLDQMRDVLVEARLGTECGAAETVDRVPIEGGTVEFVLRGLQRVAWSAGARRTLSEEGRLWDSTAVASAGLAALALLVRTSGRTTTSKYAQDRVASYLRDHFEWLGPSASAVVSARMTVGDSTFNKAVYFSASAANSTGPGAVQDGTSSTFVQQDVSGGLESIIAVLAAHSAASTSVAEHGCRLVRNMTFDHDIVQARFGQLGAGTVVVTQALVPHGDGSTIICANACAAITNLARSPKTQRLLGEAGACKAVMEHALIPHAAENREIAEYVTRAITNLGADNADHQRQLLDAGAAEGVVDQVLCVHGERSITVANQVCKAINMLGRDCDQGKVRLGLMSAGEGIIEYVLLAHGHTSSVTAMLACSAVDMLASSEDGRNATRLGEAGIFAAIFSRAVDPHAKRKAYLAETAVRALERLMASVRPNRELCADAGGCEYIVGHILKPHGTSSSGLAELGCKCVDYLAVGCTAANRAKLTSAGACEAVVDVLRAHGSERVTVAQAACNAICNLASSRAENRDVLGEAGACQAVVQYALISHGTTSENVALSACQAVIRLAMGHAENQAAFAHAGVCEAVTEVLQNMGAQDPLVAEVTCRTIRALCDCDDGANQSALGEAGACELILSHALRPHKSQYGVLVLGANAVSELARHNGQNAARFRTAGGVELLEEIEQRDSYGAFSGSLDAGSPRDGRRTPKGGATLSHMRCISPANAPSAAAEIAESEELSNTLVVNAIAASDGKANNDDDFARLGGGVSPKLPSMMRDTPADTARGVASAMVAPIRSTRVSGMRSRTVGSIRSFEDVQHAVENALRAIRV